MNKKIDKDLDLSNAEPITIFTGSNVEKLFEEDTEVEALPAIEVNLKDNDTVAVFAEGNISQAKWGELKKGYNIIKKETADYWLAHRTVRLATPEEVARHYGIK
jgi:hypothetical protein